MHLRDMLKAILLIEQFIEGMDFQAYLGDLKTQAAVERELQIVTEAAYRLKPEDEHLCPGPDWRKIRGWPTHKSPGGGWPTHKSPGGPFTRSSLRVNGAPRSRWPDRISHTNACTSRSHYRMGTTPTSPVFNVLQAVPTGCAFATG